MWLNGGKLKRTLVIVIDDQLGPLSYIPLYSLIFII